MKKLTIATILSCLHLVTWGQEPGAPTPPSPPVQAEISRLKDDVTLALMRAQFPYAIGLENLPPSPHFSQFKAELSALNATLQQQLHTNNSSDPGQILEQANLLTIYYELLVQAALLARRQGESAAANFNLEEYYITLNPQTIENWGGEDTVNSFNSNPLSTYTLTQETDGYRVLFKEHFLSKLELQITFMEDDEGQLLAWSKLLARDTLLDSLAFASSLVPNGREWVDALATAQSQQSGFTGFLSHLRNWLWGDQSSQTQESVYDIYAQAVLDEPTRQMIDEKARLIRRERTLRPILEDQAIMKVMSSYPLITPQQLVNINEQALFPGYTFDPQSEGVAEIVNAINNESHFVAMNMKFSILFSLGQSGTPDEALVDHVVKALDNARRRFLYNYIPNSYKETDDIVFSEADDIRLQKYLEGDDFESNQHWRENLRGLLLGLPQWHQLTNPEWGQRQFALEMINGVAKGLGRVDFIEGYKEQMGVLTRLVVQRLGPGKRTSTLRLAVQGLNAADNFEQAKSQFWQNFSQQLTGYDPQIPFDPARIEAPVLTYHILKSQDHGDAGEGEVAATLRQLWRQDLITLLNVAKSLQLDRPESSRTPLQRYHSSLLAQLERWQQESPNGFREMINLDELKKFPILTMEITTPEGKTQPLTDWIAQRPEIGTARGNDEIAEAMLPLLDQILQQVGDQIYQSLSHLNQTHELKDLGPILTHSARMQEMLMPYAQVAHSQFLQRAITPSEVAATWETIMNRYVHNGFTVLLFTHLGYLALQLVKPLSPVTNFLGNVYKSIPVRYFQFFFYSATAFMAGNFGRVSRELNHQREGYDLAEGIFYSDLYLPERDGVFSQNELTQQEEVTSQLKTERNGDIFGMAFIGLPLMLHIKPVQRWLTRITQKLSVRRTNKIENAFERLGFAPENRDIEYWNPDIISITSLTYRERITKDLDQIYDRVFDATRFFRPSYESTAMERVGNGVIRSTQRARLRRQMKPGRVTHDQDFTWDYILSQRVYLLEMEQMVLEVGRSGRLGPNLGTTIMEDIAAYHKLWREFQGIRQAELNLLDILTRETNRLRKLANFHRTDFETLGVKPGEWHEGKKMWENYLKAEKALNEGVLSRREFARIESAKERLEHTYQMSLMRAGRNKKLMAYTWGMSQLPPGATIPINYSKNIPVNIFGKEIQFTTTTLKSNEGLEVEVTMPFLTPITGAPR